LSIDYLLCHVSEQNYFFVHRYWRAAKFWSQLQLRDDQIAKSCRFKFSFSMLKSYSLPLFASQWSFREPPRLVAPPLLFGKNPVVCQTKTCPDALLTCTSLSAGHFCSFVSLNSTRFVFPLRPASEESTVCVSSGMTSKTRKRKHLNLAVEAVFFQKL